MQHGKSSLQLEADGSSFEGVQAVCTALCAALKTGLYPEDAEEQALVRATNTLLHMSLCMLHAQSASGARRLLRKPGVLQRHNMQLV